MKQTILAVLIAAAVGACSALAIAPATEPDSARAAGSSQTIRELRQISDKLGDATHELQLIRKSVYPASLSDIERNVQVLCRDLATTYLCED